MCSAKNLFLITIVIPIVLLGILQSSHAAFLRCYNGVGSIVKVVPNDEYIDPIQVCGKQILRSLDNYLVTPLNKPLALAPCINTELPTLIYTFGYRGKPAGPATTAVLNAYIAKRKRNVILLDWEKEAESGLLGIALGYALSAVPYAKKIGRELGQALVVLTEAGVKMDSIHLVGHSLGAHLLGYAGKRAREQGCVVARITGLDPARALFDGAFSLQSSLDRTCAKFVDIIHTDPGGYGSNSSTGTVDIWPNYTGGTGTQPGCPVGSFQQFSPEDLCSHDRSWRYFVEALGSPTAFQAAGAADVNEWIAHFGETSQTIYLADLTSTRARGNFYLKTNSASPFALGAEGLRPNSVQVRKRRNPLLMRILKYL